MMPYQVKYENHLGQGLWLDDSRYFININDLRNFSWNYDINDRPSGFGGRVTRFTRGVTERTVRVGVRGQEMDFVSRIEQLHALTEIDILANKPGRLWLKQEYIRCFMAVSSDLSTYTMVALCSRHCTQARRATTYRTATKAMWTRLITITSALARTMAGSWTARAMDNARTEAGHATGRDGQRLKSAPTVGTSSRTSRQIWWTTLTAGKRTTGQCRR